MWTVWIVHLAESPESPLLRSLTRLKLSGWRPPRGSGRSPKLGKQFVEACSTSGTPDEFLSETASFFFFSHACLRKAASNASAWRSLRRPSANLRVCKRLLGRSDLSAGRWVPPPPHCRGEEKCNAFIACRDTHRPKRILLRGAMNSFLPIIHIFFSFFPNSMAAHCSTYWERCSPVEVIKASW